MLTSSQQSLLAETDCDVRFDDLSRQLYSTDASIYAIEPLGVAFPRGPAEAAAVLVAAAEGEVPVIPRGAGTGLAGGAVGAGLVVDFSRHNRGITELDLDRRTVRVAPGVVLDQLNAFLAPHGLCFGPDVATSSRATLGGMIANNSSGARAPLYGTTIDHVESVDVALMDGRILTMDSEDPEASTLRARLEEIAGGSRKEILARMPEGLVKRWPGYGLEGWLRRGGGAAHFIGGSEGTLAAVVSARLRVVELPTTKSIGVLFFDSVSEAMSAAVEIVDLQPAAVEHIDRVLFDQTRGQLAFRRARELLELDGQPCEAILIVEFYDDDGGRLDDLMGRGLGVRRLAVRDEADMEAVWSLRKAGLSLLTGCKGPAKPTAGIEDVSVLPSRLPDYVAALQGVMARLGLEASFYGHAASGLLHVRPVVDLHEAEDVAKFRAIADEVSALTKQFKGALASEHGVGIARTEYLADHLGPELMEAHRKIKAVFDPMGLMNPGKIIGDDRFRIDTNLRQGAGSEIELPFAPRLAFAAKDECFVGNLEQCNGCGGCRKDAPTMCPTFAATGEEVMSTRGRANVIRATLEGRLGDDAMLEALGHCLSCKACKSECPSNVDLALLKAELLHARHRAEGIPLRDRLLSRVDRLGSLGEWAPGIANFILGNSTARRLLEDAVGLSRRRSLPAFARQPFHAAGITRSGSNGRRGRVHLWVDCFSRYYEPEIAFAAMRVLESAGFEVMPSAKGVCCGRPAFSLGRLDVAERQGRETVAALSGDGDPIVVLEASCYSMLAEDFRELGIRDAEGVASRAILFESFIEDLVGEDAGALSMESGGPSVTIHSHCHAKALTHAASTALTVASLATEGDVSLLNTGCCGMAGSFGALRENYDLSVDIARPLVEQLSAYSEDTVVIASGTSCRHQIEDLTPRRPLHMAEFLASRLASTEKA